MPPNQAMCKTSGAANAQHAVNDMFLSLATGTDSSVVIRDSSTCYAMAYGCWNLQPSPMPL